MKVKPTNRKLWKSFGGYVSIINTALSLVKYSLLTLHGCYFHCPSSTNNPMIRLKDDSKAKVDHCILIKEQ